MGKGAKYRDCIGSISSADPNDNHATCLYIIRLGIIINVIVIIVISIIIISSIVISISNTTIGNSSTQGNSW